MQRMETMQSLLRTARDGYLALALLASAATPALAAREAPTPDPSRELIVLLDRGQDLPTPEDLVARVRQKRPLPSSWGLGSPTGARYLVPEADRNLSGDVDPESPSGLLLRYVVLSYPLPVEKDLLLKSMGSNPNLRFAGENFQLGVSATPNDPLFPLPPGSPTPDQYQWGSAALHLPEAWDYNKGHGYIGIVDLGLAVQHPDLRAFHKVGSTWIFDRGNYRSHLAFDYGYPNEGPGCPGDPNATPGCVDEGQAEFVSPTVSCPGGVCTPSLAGHGTHVSGIAGATANNATDVAGACWNCSLISSKVSQLAFGTGGWRNAATPRDVIVAGINGAIQKGAQALNLSLGYRPNQSPPNCAANPADPFCVALQLAEERDVVFVAAAGNDNDGTPDWPALDPRVLGIAGIDAAGNSWNDCSPSLTFECGTNYSPQMINSPAKQILSTFYPTLPYSGSTCPGNAATGPCTGTSMASPYIAGSVGVLRSVNPLLDRDDVKTLLTANVENPSGWNLANGLGKPNVGAAVRSALGSANGAQIQNRLTPLFSLYSATAEDFLYTTVPQMASAAVLDAAGYTSTGPFVASYANFPGTTCQVGPCSPTTPSASVFVFTGDRAPFAGAPALVPLYRMTFRGSNPNGNSGHRDSTYTTEDAGVVLFKGVGYELDGIEGYIFPRCTPEPSCKPAGTVKLYRRYHPQRDDFAIFPESELAFMTGQGYTSTGGGTLNEVLGYVYANADADADQLIDGFEGLLGTNPAVADSDCDGAGDGAEVLGFPNGDPLGGPGCAPPVARFTFSCTALGCSFDGSASSASGAITAYAWTFGDGGTGSGAATSHTYGMEGTYTAKLTVTTAGGLTASLSRRVQLTSAAAAPAEKFFTVPLCRVYDSRTGTILSNNQTRLVQVTGNCNVPTTAKSVSVNVTAYSPTSKGSLTIVPGDQPAFPYTDLPFTLFFYPTPARSNNAILQLSTNGAGRLAATPAISGFNGKVHLVLDVNGYFSEDAAPAPGAQGPLGFQTVTPCRLADTRLPAPNPLAPGVARSFSVQGACGIPAGAAAVALNASAVAPSPAGEIVFFPADTGAPGVTNVTFSSAPSSATANGARLRLAPTAPDFKALFNSSNGTGSSHLVLDAEGYFKSDAPLRYHPIVPCRAADTRYADQGAPALAPGQTRTFQVRGNCGVPASAKAVFANLFAATPGGTGFLAAFAGGTAYPGTATVNFDTAQGAIANGVIVPLSTGGPAGDDLAVMAGVAGTDLVLDLFGYFD